LENVEIIVNKIFFWKKGRVTKLPRSLNPSKAIAIATTITITITIAIAIAITITITIVMIMIMMIMRIKIMILIETIFTEDVTKLTLS